MEQQIFELYLNTFLFGTLFLIMTVVILEFMHLKDEDKIFSSGKKIDNYFYYGLYILFIVLDIVFFLVTTFGLALLLVNYIS